MANELTRHLVIDLKTGFAYGLKLDAAGVCKMAQPLNTAIETLDGRLVRKFGPTFANPNVTSASTVPYGETTHAVELTEEGAVGKIYTIVWPTKKDAGQGALPIVTQRVLPENLVAAGIAPPAGAGRGASVSDDAALDAALKNINDMIGLGNAKRDIRQNIAVARFNRVKQEMGIATKPISRHMVFTGNPGTGKTTFAREVARVYHALGFISKPDVVEVKREDLVAGYVGQTALKTKEVIDKAKGGILFIDEAYALARGGSSSGSDGKDFGAEAIDTLVAAMENMRDDLVVIVAGYTDPMKKFIDTNEGLKSRFTTYINFEDYTLKQLGEILDFMVAERGYTIEQNARDHAIALLNDEMNRTKKDFGNGRTVRNLVEKAEKELAMRLERENLLGKKHGLSDDDLRKALTTITVDDLRGVNLQGLKPPKGIGFGSSDDESLATNDNPPPAAVRPSAGFRRGPGQ